MRGERGLRAVRERAARRAALRRCRRVARELEEGGPFDAGALLERLSVRRGRVIEVLAVPARAHAPCGLLVSTAQADYILYAADTSALHRRHIVVHEIAHLLLDHAGSAALEPAQELLGHLSPALVRRVLGRTRYDEPQEREAELLASLLLSRAARSGGRGLDALDALFAHTPGAGGAGAGG
ncbi:ParH-like protein [Kitasatospora sp. NPDC101183]|uniref:ParH-like protein n=1 Tax=Kitasatospora sp. NPDC101183 TaxID=3364100 RepID=UPI0038082BF6